MMQDWLGALRSIMLHLELLAQQHPSEEESEQLLLNGTIRMEGTREGYPVKFKKYRHPNSDSNRPSSEG